MPRTISTLIKDFLLSQGLVLNRGVSRKQFLELLEFFHPVNAAIPLRRLGGQGDGGYLIPDDFDGISACFSPGVDTSVSFEQDLARLGIRSHLADASVPGIPDSVKDATFTPKFIGASSADGYYSLDDWCSQYEPSGELLLQMDIEGYEYSTILGCSDNLLQRFRIIAMELHYIASWANPLNFLLVTEFVRKLRRHYFVVHSHPNNVKASFRFRGVECPRCLEITLLRRDRGNLRGFQTAFPHELDVDNTCNPHQILPHEWHHA